MIEKIFIGIVVFIALLCGGKAGMFASARVLLNLFIAGFAAKLLLPALHKQTAGFIPEKYLSFLDAGLLTLSVLLILVVLVIVWKKLGELSNISSGSMVMNNSPGVNRFFGLVYGGLAGYVLAAIALLVFTALPLKQNATARTAEKPAKTAAGPAAKADAESTESTDSSDSSDDTENSSLD